MGWIPFSERVAGGFPTLSPVSSATRCPRGLVGGAASSSSVVNPEGEPGSLNANSVYSGSLVTRSPSPNSASEIISRCVSVSMGSSIEVSRRGVVCKAIC